ncbi:VIT1/CCC1 transporter family protein [Salinigranum halophilum]|jgi:predicted membrane protein (TIGR00267 family)|uniref:VIT1/CCC1 transporter family protein n=1 Tax=Salinigranum halophilum TaxID=2565931 RepID=UPI0010A81637|nr:VIT1/CCC1 transporter family protein [Salinigranum halophilum]
MPPGFAERLRAVEFGSLSRRYFVSNGFDGALTCVGLVVGALLSGVTDGVTVLRVGLGAAVGLSTSAVWSVWEIERAEKRAELQELEASMLAELRGTGPDRQRRREQVVNAVASGFGPVVGILVPLVPFLVEGTTLTMFEATLASVATAVGVLFAFGAYLSGGSDRRWYVAGIRMGAAGVFVALLNVVLPG